VTFLGFMPLPNLRGVVGGLRLDIGATDDTSGALVSFFSIASADLAFSIKHAT